MHILIVEPEAKNDIAEAMSYYDQERAGLGQEFLIDIADRGESEAVSGLPALRPEGGDEAVSVFGVLSI